MEAEPESVASRLKRGEFMPGQAQPQTKDSVVDFRQLSETSKDSATRHKRKRANPGALSVSSPESAPSNVLMEPEERPTKVFAVSSNDKPVGIAHKSKPWKTHSAQPNRATTSLKATMSFEQSKRDKADRKALREQREEAIRQRREERRQARERKREKERVKNERATQASKHTVVDPAKVKRMSKKQRKNITFMPSHQTGGAEKQSNR